MRAGVGLETLSLGFACLYMNVDWVILYKKLVMQYNE